MISSYQFKSSILAGGVLVTPEIITITPSTVTWKKNKGWSSMFLTSDKISLLRTSINAVQIFENLISAEILITTNGGLNIIARSFLRSDANKIQQILLEKL